MNWYVLKSPALSLSIRQELQREGIEYFLPTYVSLSGPAGHQYRVEKPLALNMIFVREEFNKVVTFKMKYAAYRLHVAYRNRRTDTDPVVPITIPDREMKMFIAAAGVYNSAEVPYLKPTEVDLEKGDIVRILSGPFSGVEGTLISQQGKDGGRVLVSISNLIAVPTLHIDPEYLQVLQFAKKGKHFYKHIDSYIPRLQKAMKEYVPGSNLALLTPVRVFVTRFSELNADTKNAQAKLYALLIASYRLLCEADNVNKYQQLLDELMTKITSERTIEFVQSYCGENKTD